MQRTCRGAYLTLDTCNSHVQFHSVPRSCFFLCNRLLKLLCKMKTFACKRVTARYCSLPLSFWRQKATKQFCVILFQLQIKQKNLNVRLQSAYVLWDGSKFHTAILLTFRHVRTLAVRICTSLLSTQEVIWRKGLGAPVCTIKILHHEGLVLLLICIPVPRNATGSSSVTMDV